MTENQAYFVQVVEMSHDEKVKMYMKRPKRELIEMLIECNRILETREPVVINPYPEDNTGEYTIQSEDGYSISMG